jgi:hypothetical protein
MVTMVSPGVYVREVDLSTVVPAASTSLGAFVGNFAWGPVLQATTVSTENKLAEWFGKPTALIPSTDFLTAASFLSYSGAMKVVRVVDEAAKNADSAGTGSEILNENQVEDGVIELDAQPTFVARYPGALGNNISVVVIDADTYADYMAIDLKSSEITEDERMQGIAARAFDSAPSAAANEIHVVVFDRTGAITGTAYNGIEKYGYVQTIPGSKKADGGNNYVQDIIALGSSYIWMGAVEGIAGAYFELTGGVDSAIPGNDELMFGWDIFKNQEEQEDVSLLICGAVDEVIAKYVAEIAIARTDCVAFISPKKDDVVGVSPSTQLSNVVEFRANELGLDTSYAVLDSGWKYIFNKYLDRYEWIPLCADIAGLCARTDSTNDPWYSPAGYNRGNIRNCVKLAFNPDKAARDELYRNGINPVVNFRGTGPILFGDKTLQTRPSAFDRINVRRLFIVLEKAVSKASKYSLFEFNDQFTRAQFVNMVEPFLRDVQARRGIYNYKVVADETNNTPQVIDNNTFVGDIYIQPARSINFIQLNFVAVRTGVSFTEVVGKF